MNTEQKKDRRVERTQRAICDAFLKLMTEKEVDRITVKEIAQTADIDRKTIYNYYGGIHQIHEQVENELIERFNTMVQDLEYSIENPYVCFETLTKLLNENLEVYERLVCMKYNPHLILRSVEFFKGKILQALHNSGLVPEEKRELAAEFTAYGMLVAYKSWFSSDRKQSLKDFSKDVETLVLHGLYGFLEK